MPDSNITKHAIAAALKELCREKSFDKISIADITSTCGLNRQTFLLIILKTSRSC